MLCVRIMKTNLRGSIVHAHPFVVRHEDYAKRTFEKECLVGGGGTSGIDTMYVGKCKINDPTAVANRSSVYIGLYGQRSN